MSPLVLALGMSHMNALAAALRPEEAGRIEVVNLRFRPDLIDEGYQRLSLEAGGWGRPALVALLMGGNYHNVLTLKDNPAPFRLGDGVRGSVPSDSSRRFVPRDMLAAMMRRKIARFEKLEKQVHRHFAGIPIVHLAAPPPVRGLRSLPPSAPPEIGTAVSRRDLAFDAAPPDLRVRVHAVQNDLARESAARLGGRFLEPPAVAVTPEGLLGDNFWNEDPTHADARYGRLVLDALIAEADRDVPVSAS